jgi:Tfp pilus assembly protein PilO
MPDEKPQLKTAKKTPIQVPNTDMSVAEKKSNQRFMVWMGVLIGAMILVGGYGIYRLSGAYVNQANKIKAQDMLIAALNQKQQNLNELKPNYEAITAKGANGLSDSELILHALPTDADYQGLIAMLEKMGQDSGVKVTSVSQGSGSSSASNNSSSAQSSGQSSGGSSPQAFTFTVGVQGSYQGILNFLAKTQQVSRVMNFSNMTITSGTSGDIQANITFQTYYQPPANIQSTTRPL